MLLIRQSVISFIHFGGEFFLMIFLSFEKYILHLCGVVAREVFILVFLCTLAKHLRYALSNRKLLLLPLHSLHKARSCRRYKVLLYIRTIHLKILFYPGVNQQKQRPAHVEILQLSKYHLLPLFVYLYLTVFYSNIPMQCLLFSGNKRQQGRRNKNYSGRYLH